MNAASSPQTCATLKHCVGSSNEYQLRLAYTADTKYPIVLELMRRTRPLTTIIDNQRDIQRIPILPASGLPNLESVSVMDFDDGAGVILLGSCRGENYVVQFVDRSLHARGSLLDDLPTVHYNLKGLVTVSL